MLTGALTHAHTHTYCYERKGNMTNKDVDSGFDTGCIPLDETR
jgi:hypothetical protein